MARARPHPSGLERLRQRFPHGIDWEGGRKKYEAAQTEAFKKSEAGSVNETAGTRKFRQGEMAGYGAYNGNAKHNK